MVAEETYDLYRRLDTGRSRVIRRNVRLTFSLADATTNKNNRYRTFPGWVKLILIRKVTDIAAVGIEAKNEPGRFEEAFKDVPRDRWHVFEDPSECKSIIQRVVRSQS